MPVSYRRRSRARLPPAAPTGLFRFEAGAAHLHDLKAGGPPSPSACEGEASPTASTRRSCEAIAGPRRPEMTSQGLVRWAFTRSPSEPDGKAPTKRPYTREPSGLGVSDSMRPLRRHSATATNRPARGAAGFSPSTYRPTHTGRALTRARTGPSSRFSAAPRLAMSLAVRGLPRASRLPLHRLLPLRPLRRARAPAH